MPGQTFAYLRVSKLDQDLEKNKADILKLANEAHLGHVSFTEEKIRTNSQPPSEARKPFPVPLGDDFNDAINHL